MARDQAAANVSRRIRVFLECVVRWWIPTTSVLVVVVCSVVAVGLNQPSSAARTTMETVTYILLGWIFTTVSLGFLIKFIFNKFVPEVKSNAQEAVEAPSFDSDETSGGEQGGMDGMQGETPPVMPPVVAGGIIPAVGEVADGNAATATGQDADAIRWVNQLLGWLYGVAGVTGEAPGHVTGCSDHVSQQLTETLVTTLNEMTAQTALETGVLIEVLQLLPSTPAPHLNNIVVECAPNDTMTVRCTVSGPMFLRVQTTRTYGERTTESQYAVALRPVRGRVSVTLLPKTGNVQVDWMGLPEVKIALEGIQNNEAGLSEKELREVIKDVVVQSIKTMTLEFALSHFPDYPLFERARTQPEQVLPVGYDSMSRERQTHPPVLKPRQKLVTQPLWQQQQRRDFAQPPLSASSSGFVDRSWRDSDEVVDNLARSQKAFSGNGRSSPSSTGDRSPTVLHESHNYVNKPYSFECDDTKVECEELHSNKPSGVCTNGIPYNLLDKIKELALVKVEAYEKNLQYNQSFEQPDKAHDSNDISIDDYAMLYESEYEEDEDFNDYMEASLDPEETPLPKSSKVNSVSANKKTDTKIPNGLVDTLDFHTVHEPFRNSHISASHSRVAGSTQRGPSALGAMGLPHHPKCHIIPGMLGHHAPPRLPINPVLNGKKLLVKVVRATGLAEGHAVNSYVTVEVDEPNEKVTTATQRNTCDPEWGEQFVFTLSDVTQELLFELYEEPSNAFLGLGIVGVEELVSTPSQRQLLPLQQTPYHEDPVTGSLTVEFLFLDEAAYDDLAFGGQLGGDAVPQERNRKFSAGLREDATHTSAHDGGERSTGRQLPRITVDNHSPGGFGSGSRSSTPPRSPLRRSPSTPQAPTPPHSTSHSTLPNSTSPFSSNHRSTGTSYSSDHYSGDATRGRDRVKRKGSILGSIKRRFSRSRARSEAPDAALVSHHSPPPQRSASVEQHGYSRESVAPSPSLPPSSSRDSLSTSIHEDSTLIVEETYMGVVKHYLVPTSAQHRGKWHRRGTRLHVFADHAFVARHVPRSTPCGLCTRPLSRRPGKQAYQCRDCEKVVHKHCHVMPQPRCARSTVHTLNLKDYDEEHGAVTPKTLRAEAR